MERPRLGVDAIGHIRDLQALDLLLRSGLGFEDRDHRVVFGGCLGDLRDIVFKGLPFHEQRFVVREDGERVAGRHVLATLDRELLNQQRDLAVRAGSRPGCGGCTHNERAEQRSLRLDLLDLGLGKPVKQQ